MHEKEQVTLAELGALLFKLSATLKPDNTVRLDGMHFNMRCVAYLSMLGFSVNDIAKLLDITPLTTASYKKELSKELGVTPASKFPYTLSFVLLSVARRSDMLYCLTEILKNKGVDSE